MILVLRTDCNFFDYRSIDISNCKQKLMSARQKSRSPSAHLPNKQNKNNE